MTWRCPLPLSCALASRTNRPPFLLKRKGPLEHREVFWLRLVVTNLRIDRLLGHKLDPREQRPLRLAASSWWPFPFTVIGA